MIVETVPSKGGAFASMRAHIREKLPSLKEANPNVPDALVKVVERMTAKDPRDRYQSTDELFEELEAVRLKEKTGKGAVSDLDRNELLSLVEQERTKARGLAQEALGVKKQLTRMTQFFYAILVVAACSVGLVAFLALSLARAKSG